MKSKILLLTVLASLGISVNSFAQQRPPVRQEQRIEKKANVVEVRYYYIPEYNAYFDAINKVYYYNKNNKWVKTNKPSRINKNIAKAPRQPIRDLKKNEMPYDHNSQHVQTWKGQQARR
ncbi:MAG: hypothetical protein DI598_04745 [Pseudopedobacter saltans]|uniref:Uncharacterized protein n=1 Tax=Pseudopedobacter saltans TaxID=151895 RepID=A0A2W5F5Z1_9SPHI|nr:MAG: hypothetical protein DI598_04745 [Pseudopedobacter saltans]